MNTVPITAAFLIIDNDSVDANACFNTLKPFLNDQGIDLTGSQVQNSVEAGCEHLARIKGFDIVLLDIGGIDESGSALEKIRESNPYIPIVMFSRFAAIDNSLFYQEKGASAYIYKGLLFLSSNSEESDNEWDNQDDESSKQQLDTIAKLLRKLIEDYQPTKAILLNDVVSRGEVVKSEPNTPEVRNRVQYLKTLQDLTIYGDVFPKVLNDEHPERDPRVYHIPYFDLRTLRSVVLEGTERGHCEAIITGAIQKIMQRLIPEMYLGYRDFNYKRAEMWPKIVARLKEREAKIRATELPPKVPIAHRRLLEDLLDERAKNRGPRSYRHPLEIVRDLGNDHDFVSRMQPPWLSRTHGDLHFDNIMIDDRLAKAVRFRLIDPKAKSEWGELGLDDPAYDFGKLFQSTSGYYDHICVGYLIPKIDSTADLPELITEEWIESKLKGGMSGAEVTAKRRQKIRSWTKEILDNTAKRIVEIIDKHYRAQDPDWLIRARFYEAAHLFAAAHVHLPDVMRTAAVLIRSTELFNDFYDRYETDGYRNPDPSTFEAIH